MECLACRQRQLPVKWNWWISRYSMKPPGNASSSTFPVHHTAHMLSLQERCCIRESRFLQPSIYVLIILKAKCYYFIYKSRLFNNMTATAETLLTVICDAWAGLRSFVVRFVGLCLSMVHLKLVDENITTLLASFSHTKLSCVALACWNRLLPPANLFLKC